jgi:hypothetical protein
MVKDSAWNGSRHSIYLLISWCLQFLLVLFPIIWALADFKGFISYLYVPILFKLMNAYSTAAYQHKDHQCLNVPYHSFPTTSHHHTFYSYMISGYGRVLFKDYSLQRCHTMPCGLVNTYLQNVVTYLPKYKPSRWP